LTPIGIFNSLLDKKSIGIQIFILEGEPLNPHFNVHHPDDRMIIWMMKSPLDDHQMIEYSLNLKR
jgi:hypothetical protein